LRKIEFATKKHQKFAAAHKFRCSPSINNYVANLLHKKQRKFDRKLWKNIFLNFKKMEAVTKITMKHALEAQIKLCNTIYAFHELKWQFSVALNSHR
jgi:hypothetical protein